MGSTNLVQWLKEYYGTKITGVKTVVNLEAVCREKLDQNTMYEILKESKKMILNVFILF